MAGTMIWPACSANLVFVSLPDDLIRRAMDGEDLSKAEIALYNSHPEMGARLLKHIPRLEIVAEMIERQNDDIGKIDIQGKLTSDQRAILGGQILKVASNYDKFINRGMTEDDAIEQLRESPDNYDPALVEILVQGSKNRKVEILNLPISQLEPDLIVDQPIKTLAGAILVAKGQPLSQAMVFKLKAADEREVLPKSTIRVFRITQLD